MTCVNDVQQHATMVARMPGCMVFTGAYLHGCTDMLQRPEIFGQARLSA